MKRKGLKIALASVAILILLTILSVVIYWGASGVTSFEEGIQKISALILPKGNNVYRKKSYSVSDEKAVKKRNNVVARVGDTELTNGLLQIYYWMDIYEYLDDYGYYAVYYGLDYTQPLDEQTCQDTEGTWQHFFLEKAMLNWHNYQALMKKAEAEGFQLDEDLQADLDGLRASLTDSVLESDYPTIEAMLEAEFGPGTTYEDYYKYMNAYYRACAYLEKQIDKFEITDAMIQEYYNTHESELSKEGISKESGDVKDVRHILIAVEGGIENEDGVMVYTDEEWETCRAEAEALLEEWLAGDATEASFTELAYLYSEDTGSNTNGGLYENLDADSGFVQEFIDWYMDDNRQTGDYGLVRTEYGYHIMYFVGTEAQWLRHCRQGVMSDLTADVLKEAREQFPMEDVKYRKIALGVVPLGQN